MKSKQRMSPIDPALIAVMGDIPKSAPNRTMLKKYEKPIEKNRSTLTVDIPERLIISLKNLAANYETTCSQIVALLCTVGLRAIVTDKLELDKFKVFSRSLRYNWKILLPKIPHIALENKEKNLVDELEIEPIEIDISVNSSAVPSVIPGDSPSDFS